MTDWQPIETAPKDGTRILTARLHNGIDGPEWVQNTAKHFKGKWWSNGELLAWGFTHWMPLPDPPKQA